MFGRSRESASSRPGLDPNVRSRRILTCKRSGRKPTPRPAWMPHFLGAAMLRGLWPASTFPWRGARGPGDPGSGTVATARSRSGIRHVIMRQSRPRSCPCLVPVYRCEFIRSAPLLPRRHRCQLHAGEEQPTTACSAVMRPSSAPTICRIPSLVSGRIASERIETSSFS
jgi:hypothetical protein